MPDPPTQEDLDAMARVPEDRIYTPSGEHIIPIRTLARAKCPDCDKVLAVQPPRGGDGSADVFPRHGNGAGGQCPSSRTVVNRSEYVDD